MPKPSTLTAEQGVWCVGRSSTVLRHGPGCGRRSEATWPSNRGHVGWNRAAGRRRAAFKARSADKQRWAKPNRHSKRSKRSAQAAQQPEGQGIVTRRDKTRQQRGTSEGRGLVAKR